MGFVKFKIIKRSTQVQAIAGFHDWKTLRKHWDVRVEMRCLSGEGIFLIPVQVKFKGILFSFCQGCNLIDIFAPYGNQSYNWWIWKIMSLFLVFPWIWFSTKGKNRILEPIITRETRDPVNIQQCCAVHTRLKPAPRYSQLYFFCSYLNPELPLLLSLSLVFHV